MAIENLKSAAVIEWDGDAGSLLDLMEPPDWQQRAACKAANAVNLNIFYPPTNPHPSKPDKKTKEATEERAKQICATCPVARVCLDYAIKYNEPHGIWGGKTRKERIDISDQRKAAALQAGQLSIESC
ncbi:MAG: WhiB family transcriptional regulator [Candidatus Saccharimonadales bacterium]